jgi:uncharacterized protein YjiS (DUF1127 family)
MSLESVIVLTAIVTAFMVFAAVLAWVDLQTRRPKIGRHIPHLVAGSECSPASAASHPHMMVTTPVAVALRNMLQRLVDAWKNWRQRRLAIAELYALDTFEKRRLAQDLGIPTADLEVLAGRDSHSADLLLRRLASLNIDPAKIDRVVMRDMERCCSNCDSHALCEHELEDRPRAARWPDYCPNEPTIASLLDKMPAPAKH